MRPMSLHLRLPRPQQPLVGQRALGRFDHVARVVRVVRDVRVAHRHRGAHDRRVYRADPVGGVGRVRLCLRLRLRLRLRLHPDLAALG